MSEVDMLESALRAKQDRIVRLEADNEQLRHFLFAALAVIGELEPSNLNMITLAGKGIHLDLIEAHKALRKESDDE